MSPAPVGSSRDMHRPFSKTDNGAESSQLHLRLCRQARCRPQERAAAPVDGASKATDLHMPACPQRSAVVAAHQQQLQKEAAESQWATTSRTVAEIASQGAVGGACKREGCRWVLCIVITREATRSLGP